MADLSGILSGVWVRGRLIAHQRALRRDRPRSGGWALQNRLEFDCDHRSGERADEIDPCRTEVPADQGASERTGFIEAPLMGAAQRPASAM